MIEFTIDDPQFEAFLKDGAKQSNETISDYFSRTVVALFLQDYKNNGLSNEDIANKFSITSKEVLAMFEKYQITEIDNKCIEKYFDN